MLSTITVNYPGTLICVVELSIALGILSVVWIAKAEGCNGLLAVIILNLSILAPAIIHVGFWVAYIVAASDTTLNSISFVVYLLSTALQVTTIVILPVYLTRFFKPLIGLARPRCPRCNSQMGRIGRRCRACGSKIGLAVRWSVTANAR